jgi:hypothetical protein
VLRSIAPRCGHRFVPAVLAAAASRIINTGLILRLLRLKKISLPLFNMYKSGFDPTVNVRLRHSFNGGRDGEADSMWSRTRASLAPAQPVLCILDNIDPLAKLAAKR